MEEDRSGVVNQNEAFKRFLSELETKDAKTRIEEAAQGMEYFMQPKVRGGREGGRKGDSKCGDLKIFFPLVNHTGLGSGRAAEASAAAHGPSRLSSSSSSSSSFVVFIVPRP